MSPKIIIQTQLFFLNIIKFSLFLQFFLTVFTAYYLPLEILAFAHSVLKR